MGQVQKEHINKMIIEIALRMFAIKGYRNTPIADIAKEAGISVGNMYRYYESKQQLFNAVLPEDFVSNFKEQLLKKIITGKASNIREQMNDSSYIINSEAFQSFVLSNKMRLLILFRSPEDTPYETFKEEFIQHWVQIVLDNFIPNKNLHERKRSTLSILFHGYLELYCIVLAKAWDESKTLEQLKQINRYHIFGLTPILEEQ